ncbi:aa3-type cytochrome c oxidase subunit IV [Roseivivax sp. CAU 1753]
MAEHKHGEMDITTHEKTFEGFVTLVTRIVIVILVAVVLLAIFNG